MEKGASRGETPFDPPEFPGESGSTTQDADHVAIPGQK